jgi:alpha-glucoside transport system permease protein
VPRRRLRLPRGGKQFLLAGLFLAPALAFLGAVVVYPAIATGVRSFFDRSGSEFVGLDNYETMFELRRMRRAIVNSFVWVAAFPVLVVTFGLILAVLADRIPWKTAFKTVLFLPMAISLLASGVIWRIMYEADPDRGAINAVLDAPRGVFEPTGRFPDAVPSVDTARVASDRTVTVSVDVGADGGVAHLGMLRIAPDEVPDDAAEAREPPAPRSGELAGVVWRDIRAGDDEKGVVEEGEFGLPDVPVRVRATDGSFDETVRTAPDGTFRLEGVDPGAYELRLDGELFRPPWKGITWLGESLVTPAAIVAATWVWAGFAMVVIGAGLAALDRELLEAARVDGASEWQVFRRVTVPLLAPVLGVVFITMTINALKMFDLVFAIAPGSVQDEANVIALEMWRTAFTGAGNRGLGAAIAVFLFVLVLPIIAFNIRRFRIEEGRR